VRRIRNGAAVTGDHAGCAHDARQPERCTHVLTEVNALCLSSRIVNMHKHILITTDGSELSRAAIEYGIALAKSVGAKATAITVTPPHKSVVAAGVLTDAAKEHLKRMELLAAQYLSIARDAAAAAGIACELVHREHHQPYQAIIDVALEKPCDLIIMASHENGGLSAVVLGSETLKVLTHSSIPVLVYRAPRHESVFVSS
jgi:nucleotide-binding universal stress UspA family protein